MKKKSLFLPTLKRAFRCDAKAFHLSKSHKKILKKMNNFLRTGQKGGDDGATAQTSIASSNNRTEGVNPDADCDMKMNVDQQQQHQQIGSGEESSALTEMKMITSNQPKIAIDMDNVLKVIENAENGEKSTLKTGNVTSSSSQINHTASDGSASNSHNNSQMKESQKRGAVTGPDPTKPLQPKAKLLRQQRKAEKLLAKANASPAIATAEVSSADAAATVSVIKNVSKNMEKTLKAFIDETPTDGKHKLKV